MKTTIKLKDLKKYFGASGNEPKKERSLDIKELVSYLEEIGVDEIEIEHDGDEISYMHINGTEMRILNGYVIEYIINNNGSSVRFEDYGIGGFEDAEKLEFEFE